MKRKLLTTDLIINSKNDFTKTVQVTIPQYSEPGIWTLDSISQDSAGNGKISEQIQKGII